MMRQALTFSEVPLNTGHNQIHVVVSGLGEHVAAQLSQHSEPDVRVALEDSTDEVDRQVVVK